MEKVRPVVVSFLHPSFFWCPEESWVRSFAKLVLSFLAFIFWGIAAMLVYGGVYELQMHKNYGYLFQESFLPLLGWLAVAMALILIPTGVLAVSTSTRSSYNQQVALIYLLLVLFCLEMSSAALAQFSSIRIASELKSAAGHLFYQYNGIYPQGPVSRAMDIEQRKMQCCGVQNCTDWLKATSASWHLLGRTACVSESCCKKHSNCGSDLGHLEQLFQEGCLKKLEDQLHFVILYIFWCSTVLSVLGLLAAVSSGILMRYEPFYDLQILQSSTFP
ncbi:tetraspanin-3-like [Neopsephotus bourkii]|uniref:tetraspanin-3-like n=1 Tax=Neopsephotus bourkii TaxID=309878 RepID=UPI002AA50C80|nr:tetraspanin-3-like [Neopsephotus bourkii]